MPSLFPSPLGALRPRMPIWSGSVTATWVWLAGAASYMILAGQFSLDEIAAGVILGALGAAWHAAVIGDGARTFSFERSALAEVSRALAGLPGAVFGVGRQLARALTRDVEGRRVEQPFYRGHMRNPRDTGRRALVVLATSLAPDSFVLRMPLDEEVIAFHVLAGDAPSIDPRWPS